jgi:NAD-dependent deacetylase
MTATVGRDFRERSVADTSQLPTLYVWSGAGLSADSGIPTFRDVNGLWTQEDFDRVCNFETWRMYRDEVFDFYDRRLHMIERVKPNSAHKILAAWQGRWGPDRVTLITQNIDGLLEAEGAQAVTHVHGDLEHMFCVECDLRFPRQGSGFDRTQSCPRCGEFESVKPGTIFFNEPAPEYEAIMAMKTRMTQDDIFVAVGTSFTVVSPYHLLNKDRLSKHRRNVLIDPRPTYTEFFGLVVEESAGTGLGQIAARIERAMQEEPTKVDQIARVF